MAGPLRWTAAPGTGGAVGTLAAPGLAARADDLRTLGPFGRRAAERRDGRVSRRRAGRAHRPLAGDLVQTAGIASPRPGPRLPPASAGACRSGARRALRAMRVASDAGKQVCDILSQSDCHEKANWWRRLIQPRKP